MAGSQPGASTASAATAVALPGPVLGTPADRYKWVAALEHDARHADGDDQHLHHADRAPDIFRGIGLDPLAPGNVGYLLWMLMGFLVVTAVLVVAFGRIGDIYGRVKMYARVCRLHARIDPARGRLVAGRRRSVLSDRDARSCRASARRCSWRTPPPS